MYKVLVTTCVRNLNSGAVSISTIVIEFDSQPEAVHYAGVLNKRHPLDSAHLDIYRFAEVLF
jgi:hypothetical protein